MFDYQAGEKYKLTLIMVGVAGLLAGMFFTLLLMPTEAPASRKRAQYTRAMNDPDVTGSRMAPGYAASPEVANLLPVSGAQPTATSAASMVDRTQAHTFMVEWLPRVWDLGANTAGAAQEWAIAQMTASCAQAYRQNIWTPELANQIKGSGLQSTFTPSTIDISENLKDGSVVIKVTGVQALGGASGQSKTRQVNVEYMMIRTPEGMKIAGISDNGQH